MSELLHFVGEHPFLTVIILLILCSWTPFYRGDK
jgi:hypothetical protein